MVDVKFLIKLWFTVNHCRLALLPGNQAELHQWSESGSDWRTSVTDSLDLLEFPFTLVHVTSVARPGKGQSWDPEGVTAVPRFLSWRASSTHRQRRPPNQGSFLSFFFSLERCEHITSNQLVQNSASWVCDSLRGWSVLEYSPWISWCFLPVSGLHHNRNWPTTHRERCSLLQSHLHPF